MKPRAGFRQYQTDPLVTLYARRSQLTRRRRLRGVLLKRERMILARITRRIDRLERYESLPERQHHRRLMRRLDAIARRVAILTTVSA